jgi:hypothetical protein
MVPNGRTNGRTLRKTSNLPNGTNGTNGCQMDGQMDKMVDKHQFGENVTNGRAYVLIYAPIWHISKCPE